MRIDPLSTHHPVLVAYRSTDMPWSLPDGPGRLHGGDLAVVLGGTAVVVALLAAFVARVESELCQSNCNEVPATYGNALYWILSRMTGGDPEGVGASDPWSRAVGLLLTIYGLFVLVSIVGRVVAQRMAEDARSGSEVVAAFVSEHAPLPAPTRPRRPVPRRHTRRVAGR